MSLHYWCPSKDGTPLFLKVLHKHLFSLLQAFVCAVPPSWVSASGGFCPELPSRSAAKLGIKLKIPYSEGISPKSAWEDQAEGCICPWLPHGTTLPNQFCYRNVPQPVRMGKGTLGSGDVFNSDAWIETKQKCEFIKCSSDNSNMLGKSTKR